MASALLFSAGSFAQKDQLKAAEKAVKSGDMAGAQNNLAQAEALLANDDDRAQFFYIKGNVYAELAKRGVESSKNYAEALKSYQSLNEVEKKSGKSKYSKQAEAAQLVITNAMKNDAYKDYAAGKYKESSQKYYQLYQLDKTQTDYLFNASSAALNSNDNDLALPLLMELRQINYTGEGTSYIAVSKLTGKEEGFINKESRDNAVKGGTYEKPTDEKNLSKRPGILRSIAIIQMKKGVLNDEVKAIIAEAEAANPTDTSIMLDEAALYYTNKDEETYKKIISKILEKDPSNAQLIFNMGVVSYKNKDFVSAEKFYNRVMELKPDFPSVNFNMAALKLDVSDKLLNQMNQLGNSAADNKKYDELKKQRDAVLAESVAYLEKHLKQDPNDNEAKRSLVSVYNALDMLDKAKALKATIKE
ncbi:hypothetical protein HYN48_11575 [Flavobacterium magnum]|uniref:Uncharacterized protein n=2 Tax=Flavobacterium magnum TaxID=2162713 RepID=A0A2S0RIX0_9FLAO|nr:hypothetical protein HYN48_11575 [Flavobacterium magnum]